MPNNVVHSAKDEKHWREAKMLARKEGHGGDYAYIMGIYKKMGGLKKQAEYDAAVRQGFADTLKLIKEAGWFNKGVKETTGTVARLTSNRGMVYAGDLATKSKAVKPVLDEMGRPVVAKALKKLPTV